MAAVKAYHCLELECANKQRVRRMDAKLSRLLQAARDPCNAPNANPVHLFPRKIGTSIDSRAYSLQNSPANATREAAELWSLGTPQPGLTNDAHCLGTTSKADTMITTTGVLARRSLLPPAAEIPCPRQGATPSLSTAPPPAPAHCRNSATA
jgi:hypothetical protein